MRVLAILAGLKGQFSNPVEDLLLRCDSRRVAGFRHVCSCLGGFCDLWGRAWAVENCDDNDNSNRICRGELTWFDPNWISVLQYCNISKKLVFKILVVLPLKTKAKPNCAPPFLLLLNNPLCMQIIQPPLVFMGGTNPNMEGINHTLLTLNMEIS